MADKSKKHPQPSPLQKSLFDRHENEVGGNGFFLSSDQSTGPKNPNLRPASRQDIRALQEVVWKEALLALRSVGNYPNDSAFQDYWQEHLPQNSLSTRIRYTRSLMRWFFPDGVRGLAARIWLEYGDQNLAEEILRYLYLLAEPMVGVTVADALFPIAENALLPVSYLPNFVRARFGEDTPAKSIQRLKSNLRKLGFLVRGKGNRDTLKAMAPSATGFLVVLHYLFAFDHASGVEFRTLAADPFWKYLGFKSEDQLRTILKGGLANGLLAKYVLADRIESVSFRYTFMEFVAGRMAL